jgi:hypothetical protein
MSKKQKNEQPDFSVPAHHQTALRLLLAEIAVTQAAAQATLNAQQKALTDFVRLLLEERNLDPTLFGINRQLTEFVLLKQEVSTVEQAKPNGEAGPQLVPEAQAPEAN